jgi:hypothetical protein
MIVLAGAAIAACSSPSPSTPSVSFVTPTAQTPSNNTTFNYTDQPVTLKITNAQKTGNATTTYSVEVASDSGFANKVFTKDGIPEDGSGVTGFSLPVLPGNLTYFWHSRAVVDNVGGQFSSTQTFFVRPQITIQAPGIFAPGDGSSAVGARPIFTAIDSGTSGPVGTLFYTFQVARDSGFTSIVASGAIQEQQNQTSFVPSSDLAAGSYFWRVQAQDLGNKISSPFSSVSNFKVVPFDMTQATIVSSPSDLGSWPVTATITSVVFTPISFEVDFDRRDSDDRWPDTKFGSDGSLQYTLGMCVNPGGAGHWYCSATTQFWFGRDLDSSAQPDNIANTWFYDARWAPITGYQPDAGETVGLFVCGGNCRGTQVSGNRERSNVAFTSWYSDYFASSVFAAKRIRR